MSEHEHIVSYKVIVIIWLVLLVLTGVTVTVSYVDLGALNIWVALGIASTKSALIISFFMHMKYERPIFKLFLLVALCILAIFIGFTFFDVLYR
ncbi:MAG: cytochrome C oxidase subunit IV family protein [Candidatus Scalinduaceae bacterium]